MVLAEQLSEEMYVKSLQESCYHLIFDLFLSLIFIAVLTGIATYVHIWWLLISIFASLDPKPLLLNERIYQ